MKRSTVRFGGVLVPTLALLVGCSASVGGQGEKTGATGEDLAAAPDDQLECKTTGFDGRATGLDVRVGVAPLGLGAAVVVSDTGPLPETGGVNQAYLLNASVSHVATAGVLDAETSTNATTTTSTVSVTGLALHVAGLSITAKVLRATATASCVAGAQIGGGADIAGLSINGLDVLVTGLPNQTINLGVATIVLNERTDETSTESVGEIHVAALHITALGVADVILSAANAGVDCACDTFPSSGPRLRRAPLRRSARRGRRASTARAGSATDLRPRATGRPPSIVATHRSHADQVSPRAASRRTSSSVYLRST